MTVPQISILTPTGSDLSDALAVVGLNYDETINARTHFVMEDTDSGYGIVFDGTGFKYDADGHPTRGTVTSIRVTSPGDHNYAQFSNISLSLTKLVGFLAAGHPQDVYDLIGSMISTGNKGADFIVTGNGDDILQGMAGNDRLSGGAGGDSLDGGKGSDTADYSSAAKNVVANLADPSHNTHDAAGDTYTSIENLTGTQFKDILTGNDGANLLDGYDSDDELHGGKGADTLLGSEGNDLLFGGRGTDRLLGGGGNDHFVFARDELGTSAAGADDIADWNGGDRIAVDAESFGHGLVAGDKLTPDQFHVGSHSIGTNGQFYYNATQGVLYWDSDGKGATHAVAVAHLDNNVALIAHDIIVI